MTLGELVNIVRLELDDNVVPYLVSDPELIEYAVDAENEACRRARLLVDATTTAICRISVIAGTAVYALDPRVIFVRRVKTALRPLPLGHVITRELDGSVANWEIQTGNPVAFITDWQTGSIVLYPIPNANDTASLQVVRLPLADMKAFTDKPEIHPSYHRSLRCWMKYRFYSKQDAETKNDKLAADNFSMFAAEFGVKPNALSQEFDARNQPMDNLDATY